MKCILNQMQQKLPVFEKFKQLSNKVMESESSSNTRDMDQSNNNPSFFKLIEEDDPLFLQIHNDYASLMWGEQPPYKESVKIVDGNKLWLVRLKKLIWALYLVMASPKLFGIVV
ncbi:uncharacterized protein LOC118492558 isoform X2 [Helianthus annuus]|nr:uncharacterized protein LOC118492558 isoform X2 [Helianthus annuus]